MPSTIHDAHAASFSLNRLAVTDEASSECTTAVNDMDTSPRVDPESDYGSEFSPEDELLLIALVAEEQQGATKAPDLITTKQSSGTTPSAVLSGGKLARSRRNGDVFKSINTSSSLRGIASYDAQVLSASSDIADPISICDRITFPGSSRDSIASADFQTPSGNLIDDAGDESSRAQDARSPLQMFRSFPKKPLSVTDLTAGAWCELQYWFTLTRLPGGRRTRTQAMKGGSKIHKELEDEVHETVRVDILTKEEGFALRMWNFVQGLRTLRDTGLTRELEVWGVVHGSFVIGVIDALSHQNPDPDFEEEDERRKKRRDPNQMTLDGFLHSGGARAAEEAILPKVFLLDVKTRGSRIPVSKALLRPAKIQLLLYHLLLCDIAAGRLDFSKLFSRYGLDSGGLFSDGFVSQMSGLHTENETSTSITDMENCKNLSELVKVVEDEIRLAFPLGEASIGRTLRVQYVHREDGSQIDAHDFPVSKDALDDYLTHYMTWWHGERSAAGVDIEEAFKCRKCEFSSNCSWRMAMAKKYVSRAHEKVLARRKAAPEDSAHPMHTRNASM